MKKEIKNKISNVSSNVVSNFWGKLEHVNFNFLLKKGNSVNLTHEVYGKSDGIAVLLYNSTSKNIVLVKQFRMAYEILLGVQQLMNKSGSKGEIIM